MNDVLCLVARTKFFPRHESVPGSIVQLVEEHMMQYAQIVDLGLVAAPAIILGGERTLRGLRDRIASEPGGEAFADRWNAKLGRFLQRVTDEAMQDAVVRDRIGPPLWSVPQIVNVVQPLVVDDPETLLANTPTAERELWWELACTVEKNAWNALIWEVVDGSGAGKGPNPFLSLVRVQAEGFYPLGFVGQRFMVFALSSSPSDEFKHHERGSVDDYETLDR
ncbi:hypothetical protein WME75_44785 [Sorangium sp. So ce1014]|uniref:hypothetical protein n=1 Tax=Sorangium sp. So ce1014 TaxID=3133326 RepID=UPI003F61453E